MNYNARRLLLAISCVVAFCFATLASRAAVTNVAWYRLGENDPGAAHGLTPTNSIDLVSNRVLTFSGGPLYDNGIASSAALHAGSSLGVRFSGTNWGTNAVVSTLV